MSHFSINIVSALLWPEKLAVISAAVFVVTAFVVMLNDADVAPARTVTVLGGVASALLDVRRL